MSFADYQVTLQQAAYAAVLHGQSYRIGDQQLTRADAPWISSELDKWLSRQAPELSLAACTWAATSSDPAPLSCTRISEWSPSDRRRGVHQATQNDRQAALIVELLPADA